MKIKIYPEDLIRRALWDNFVYYCVGSEKEAEKILTENREFDLSERDALVIGLLKVIETDNLIHKFNTYILDFLSNKSINNNNQTVVRKKTLDVCINKFPEKFPSYWNADISYKKALGDLDVYIKNFQENLEKIEVIKITDMFGTYDFLNSNNIKKLLSFNY